MQGSDSSVPAKSCELHHEKGSGVNYLAVNSELKTQVEGEFNKNIYQEIAVA